jgi:hypothetical protein
MLLDRGCYLKILSYPQQPLFWVWGANFKIPPKILYITLETCIEARLNICSRSKVNQGGTIMGHPVFAWLKRLSLKYNIVSILITFF